MSSKSLIQFSVDGEGCVPSLLFDRRPNFGGGNEDNGDLLQKVPCRHCCTQCPRPCSRPPVDHTSTEIPGHSEASLGQSPVGSLLLSPDSWCTQGFLCPPRVCFPSPAHSPCGSVVGLMVTSFKIAYATPRCAVPRAPAPMSGYC